jgi:predicted esterase YcpF (UPF0227 family)
MAVVGSSLGGFYATCGGARQTGCPAVLLNPAVDPARDLARHIGTQTQFHAPDETFLLRSRLHRRTARPGSRARHGRPQRYAAVIAQGDEVLELAAK